MGYEIDFNPYQSLMELAPDSIDPDTLDEEAAQWLVKLSGKAVRKLSAAELCFLLRQQCALPYTAPLAMEKLSVDPFLEAAEYPGDLLGAILESDSRFWQGNYALWSEMIVMLGQAVETLQKRMEEEERGEYMPWHVGDDFMSALVHFRGIHKE